MKVEIFACAFFIGGGSAAAAQATLTGRSEAGFVMSRGNADTETANARISIVRESDEWRHNLDLAGLYGRSTEAEIASRWHFLWQTDRRIGNDAYLFGNFRYEDDRFGGFDYQGTVSTGAGHEFINNESTKLHAQFGLGFRQLRTEVLTLDATGVVIDRVDGEEQSDIISSGAVNFEHAFNDATKVVNVLSFESGSSNTLTRNELAFQVKMNEVLAISLGLSIRNNSNPPAPLEERDTLTTVNLVYELKK
jgi:putative salt-induced outer membrane protein